jgi:hypothetical protein
VAATNCAPGLVIDQAPRPVADGVRAAAVAYEAWMGSLHDSRAIALKNDGTVWVWNKGEGSSRTSGTTLDLTGIVAIAAGIAGDVALGEDGTVWQWDDSLTPMQVPGLTGMVAVATAATGPGWAPQQGGDYNIALKSDGTVWAWSRGATPVQVDGLGEVAKIAAAGVYLYTSGIVAVRVAVKRDGTLWYW